MSNIICITEDPRFVNIQRTSRKPTEPATAYRLSEISKKSKKEIQREILMEKLRDYGLLEDK